jgi:hypothetical protein
MSQRPVEVGLIGSQFISAIHAEALQRCPQAIIAAEASPTPGNAARFAERFGIPQAFTDYRQLLMLPSAWFVKFLESPNRECEDGAEIWFDITDMYNTLEKRHQPTDMP